MTNIVGVYSVSDDAIIPFLGTEMSACHDLCACLHNETVRFHGRHEGVKVEKFDTPDAFVRLFPDELALIPTGLIFCLPRRFFLDIRSRSGNTWKRFLTVANQPGTIDADYTKETYVLLQNRSMNPQIIKTGDAIAQCKLTERIDVEFVSINEDQFNEFTDDVKSNSKRDGGFGHTDE